MDRAQQQRLARRDALVAAHALAWVVRLHRHPRLRRRAQARRVARLGWGRS